MWNIPENRFTCPHRLSRLGDLAPFLFSRKQICQHLPRIITGDYSPTPPPDDESRATYCYYRDLPWSHPPSPSTGQDDASYHPAHPATYVDDGAPTASSPIDTSANTVPIALD
ncbi:hypothetical protein BHE74_00005025 [Ensete ventricosum]|nr:hypothetical protein BHE74_00005025 [Ensete ventricosum]